MQHVFSTNCKLPNSQEAFCEDFLPIYVAVVQLHPPLVWTEVKLYTASSGCRGMLLLPRGCGFLPFFSPECDPLLLAPKTEPDCGGVWGWEGKGVFQPKI